MYFPYFIIVPLGLNIGIVGSKAGFPVFRMHSGTVKGSTRTKNGHGPGWGRGRSTAMIGDRRSAHVNHSV